MVSNFFSTHLCHFILHLEDVHKNSLLVSPCRSRSVVLTDRLGSEILSTF